MRQGDRETGSVGASGARPHKANSVLCFYSVVFFFGGCMIAAGYLVALLHLVALIWRQDPWIIYGTGSMFLGGMLILLAGYGIACAKK